MKKSRPRSSARSAVLSSSCGMLLVVFGACLSGIEPDVGPLRAGTCSGTDSDPTQDVSFNGEILPLLQRSGSQGGCSCHQPSNPSTPGIDATGLSLENYASLMRGSDEPVVVPYDPCASIIVQKVSPAPPEGARMPAGGPPFLTPAEIALLSDWIAEGAHDN